MASGKKTKLFKIASEINIGKDAIVEFLQSKGFSVENKPTADLSDEMVDVVYEKFKKEKIAAVKQREKVEKQKQIRRISTAEPSEEPLPKPKVETIPEAIKKPEAVIEKEKPLKTASKKAEEKIIEEPVSEKIKEEPKPVKSARIFEKIDLEAIQAKEKKRSKTKPSKKNKVIEKKPQKETIVKHEVKEKKEEKKKEEITPSEKEVVVAKEEKIKPIPVKEEKHEPAIKVEIPKEEKKEIKPAAGTFPVPEPEKPMRPKGKKKRKKKKIAEVEIEPGEIPKLRGLTIVGKIELDRDELEEFQERRDKKVKPKLLEMSEDELELRGKGKYLKVKKKGKGKIKERLVEKVRLPDKRKRKKISVRDLISEDEIDKAIRQTLAGMEESSQVSQRSKLRQKKRAERVEKEMRKIEELELNAKTLQLTEFVTTNDLSNLMGIPASEIIVKCMQLGLMVSINQRLDKDTITLIADDYGYNVEFLDEKAVQILQDFEEEESKDDLSPRSPIVTVMGHVDHGKTSLLDFVRSTNVVAGEAGGITQHIGAYRVAMPGDKFITFLDTPGHEAFTAMRARGAQVTDIVVLVVAADDNVMPQTIEAISHAQAANVPIIVAINKIDKPEAKPDRIKQQLTDYNILVEDWGGKQQSVEISAKFGTNVEDLLEKILLEAELLDLKANYLRKARCVVIEANMDRGFGAVATVIVQKGTLRVGDPFIAGVFSGRIRAMFDERYNRVDEALPSMPVRVIGFDGLPEAGDILAVVDTDVEARVVANERQQLKREQALRQVHLITLDDISKQIQLGGVKDLHLIIKGDVSGSIEALGDSLLRLSHDEVRVTLLHKGVGSITESDVMLAVASQAVIIGFQVSPTAKARKLAEKEGVDIRLYSIIYDAIDEIKLALEGMLAPELREEITATVEVRQIFRVSKIGFIAGCIVQEGKVSRNDRVRLLRDGLPVYNGTIHSLKRNKDDVKEVESGYECGIMLDGFQDFEEADILESYKLLEVKRTLV